MTRCLSIFSKFSTNGTFLDLFDIYLLLINNSIKVDFYIMESERYKKSFIMKSLSERYQLSKNIEPRFVPTSSSKMPLKGNLGVLTTTFNNLNRYPYFNVNKLILIASKITKSPSPNSYSVIEQLVESYRKNKEVSIYSENPVVCPSSNYRKKINLESLKKRDLEKCWYLNLTGRELSEQEFNSHILPIINSEPLIIQVNEWDDKDLSYLSSYNNVNLYSGYRGDMIYLFDKQIYFSGNCFDNTCRSIIESFYLGKEVVFVNPYTLKDGAQNRYLSITEKKASVEDYSLKMEDPLIQEFIN